MLFSLSPNRTTLQFLEEIKDRHSVEYGMIVVAWARITGARLLHKALADKLKNITALVGVSEGNTSAEAIHALLMTCKSVHIFDDAAALIFHPKVYLFSDSESEPKNASVQVGSSNLTGGGLVTNYEGNVELYLTPADTPEHKKFLDQMQADLLNLWKTEFCIAVSSEEDIKSLVAEGILRSEKRLRRKDSALEESGAKAGSKRKKSKKTSVPHHELPFEVPDFGPIDSQEEEPQPEPVGGAGEGGASPGGLPDFLGGYDGTVFVRTLTETDIGKLVGGKTGTLEPDLTVTARDVEPEFWGWPDNFSVTTHKLPRLQWEAKAVLRRSPSPESKSKEVLLRQWFRDKRKDDNGKSHAAEHRFQISPVSDLRDVAPDNFDENSLIVFQRRDDPDAPFEIFFVLPTDPEYDHYSGIANVTRPQHRFGYQLPAVTA